MKNVNTEISTSKENDRVIEYAGLSFYIIYNTDSLKTDDIVFYDAVIIQAGDPEFTRHIITRIRGHFNPEHYLKPVLLLNQSSLKDPYINLIDGTLYSLEQIKLILPSVQNILLRIKDLTFTSSLSYEALIIQKTISFMYSRNIDKMKPNVDFNSGIGYNYPILSVNFSRKEEHQVLNIIKTMTEEKLITKEFHDSVYLCNNCTSGYMSYREVCPKCNSSNAVSQDIVHHFPCSYVGPIEDFKNQIDDELNCPKCNKTLRHIGVDYDKPSIVNDCLSCGHRYQDFNVKAKCMNCQFDNEVEELKKSTINVISITKKGQVMAVNGYVTTSRDLQEIKGTVKLDTFTTMLKYEVERLKQTDGKSNLAVLHLKNSGEAYSKMTTDLQKTMLNFLIQDIRKNIPTSSIITFYSSSTILISLNDLPLKIAKRLTQDIVDLMTALIETNFKDMVVSIDHSVKPVSNKLSGELQIQQLVKDYF
ncbi:TackOD1 domain-containing metal-binding protein [Brumimicrobium oceani]|uniref:Thaumarchaeal output domain-containing protein n=1 Tax=Brumimicrobium oceani TaxID=2100725 RepID=A0A2U2XFW9_9FLAO|nr:hypothetical protein [Brumimicrobium oceani]PWH86699.1 hypothetical protein DIT68_00070 [Brumimicrobium oceani]